MIITDGVMSFLGRRYNAVRGAFGLPGRSMRRATTTQQAPSDEIRRVVAATPGEVITAIGVIALALLLKPF